MVDTTDSKSVASNGVGVRVPPAAPKNNTIMIIIFRLIQFLIYLGFPVSFGLIIFGIIKLILNKKSKKPLKMPIILILVGVILPIVLIILSTILAMINGAVTGQYF